ncbi:MAG: DUF1996 domain-containing protein [Chloroflexi bacterium]|nr:DUF1996 domain-containing protein [Chloroflexota bacterium]
MLATINRWAATSLAACAKFIPLPRHSTIQCRRRGSLTPLVLTIGWLTLLLGSGMTAASLQRPVAIGEFVAFCPFSHRAMDDPILFPGMAGHSHNHDFFANSSTAATSTLESLLANPTTCDPAQDRSAYWVPTLYTASGAIIPVEQATFYYTVHIDDAASLQPYPLGLKMIAGQATATSAPQPAYFKWSCLGEPDSSTTDFVVCPAGSKLELLLDFPDCWNGRDLDSTDHKSHMAYSINQACPANYPVAVPVLQFKLRYASRGEAGMRLASGAGYTAHGDFFNAWQADALANRLNCLRKLVKCGPEGFAGADTRFVYLPLLSK